MLDGPRPAAKEKKLRDRASEIVIFPPSPLISIILPVPTAVLFGRLPPHVHISPRP